MSGAGLNTPQRLDNRRVVGALSERWERGFFKEWLVSLWGNASKRTQMVLRWVGIPMLTIKLVALIGPENPLFAWVSGLSWAWLLLPIAGFLLFADLQRFKNEKKLKEKIQSLEDSRPAISVALKEKVISQKVLKRYYLEVENHGARAVVVGTIKISGLGLTGVCPQLPQNIFWSRNGAAKEIKLTNGEIERALLVDVYRDGGGPVDDSSANAQIHCVGESGKLLVQTQGFSLLEKSPLVSPDILLEINLSTDPQLLNGPIIKNFRFIGRGLEEVL